jgi:hypothetical protein
MAAAPGGAADGWCSCAGVQLVSVRFAEDEHVDVPYRPLAGLPFMSGGPGSVDVSRGNPADGAQDVGKDGRDSERPGQHLSQPGVIRAGGIRPDEPGIPDLTRCDQAGLLGALNLAVDRRVGGAWAPRMAPADFASG